jgi:predicted tellurium resistance membrane protein TerC
MGGSVPFISSISRDTFVFLEVLLLGFLLFISYSLIVRQITMHAIMYLENVFFFFYEIQLNFFQR